jgi:hypothetical protein
MGCLLGFVAILGVPVGFGLLVYGMLLGFEFMWRVGAILLLGTPFVWIYLIVGSGIPPKYPSKCPEAL